MRARAVIGANFGDEGKGLLVDYLCAREGAGVVVRSNGGAQAGHTVVEPGGARHVFSHFGSGTFVGVPTFLSQHFVCNPILFAKELQRLPMPARVYAHPDCLVTTPADMLLNQELEKQRGDARHGSCGVGFNATIERSVRFPPAITMRDVWDHYGSLEGRLSMVVEQLFRCFDVRVYLSDGQKSDFIDACRTLATCVAPRQLSEFTDPIFEGAQGLLLDQNRRDYFPHVTRSNTGMRNVRLLCEEAGIEKVRAYYVSRTYVTRHGAGPLPGHDPLMSFPDDTNVWHPFQGLPRHAKLDPYLLNRCAEDNRGRLPSIVLTHCDQLPPPAEAPHASLYAYGPDRTSIVDHYVNFPKAEAAV